MKRGDLWLWKRLKSVSNTPAGRGKVALFYFYHKVRPLHLIFFYYNISTCIWRQRNYWRCAARPNGSLVLSTVPPVPHPGSYLVVTELVVFSLCGQTSLSCYCTHADAAANPIHPHPLQPPPPASFNRAAQQWGEANGDFNTANAALHFPITSGSLGYHCF